MQKRWFIKTPPETNVTNQLQQDLKISELMAVLLAQRGLTTQEDIRSYFNPDLGQLHDPFLMLNMNVACERVIKAIDQNEKVLIYGDYDVDGTTSVAMIYSALSNHVSCDYYIPDRYEEGYGLSRKGIDFAKTQNCTLLIALDCGIREVENIAYAKSIGIEVIVCDHHTPGDELPEAIVLDPKQDQCNYPYKELCGCGVGWKLLQAVFSEMKWDEKELLALLDFVAIAIGADIVPVTGENRVLAKVGLERLNKNPRIGIKQLVEIAGKSFPLSLTNVVFTIAPRINAAGRLQSGSRSVELLLSDNVNTAKAISSEIDDYNTLRREMDKTMTEEALELISLDSDFERRKSTVLYKTGWSKGVVGIVASRLIERHYRPTIVLSENEGLLTGSARSVGDFNIYEAINDCGHLLVKYGGHHHAAGLTLETENFDLFRNEFDKLVQERLHLDDKTEELVIDSEVQFSDLFLSGESIYQLPRLYKMQDQMEPFGPQNQQPVFCIRSVYAQSYRVLKDAHLKIEINDPKSNVTLSAIAFNMADKEPLIAPGCAFDVVFTLESNTWNDRTTLQLMVKDIRES